jgi:hypothetical protein
MAFGNAEPSYDTQPTIGLGNKKKKRGLFAKA